MDKIKTFSHKNPNVLIREIGRRLREHRKACGWTQAELAERAGVSLSTLKLLEREGKGSLQRLAKVAVILGLDEGLRSLFREEPGYASMDEVLASRKRARRIKP